MRCCGLFRRCKGRSRSALRPTPPDEQAAFRIDYRVWLAQLGDRNRRIAEDMALDHSTKELATMHRLSQGRISQLRREFHLDWRRFHGEAV